MTHLEVLLAPDTHPVRHFPTRKVARGPLPSAPDGPRTAPTVSPGNLPRPFARPPAP